MSSSRARKQRKRATRKSASDNRLGLPENGSGSDSLPLERRSVDDAMTRFPYWLYGLGTAPTFDDALAMAETAEMAMRLIGHRQRDVPNWTATSTASLIDAINSAPTDVAAAIAISSGEYLTYLWEAQLWTGTEQSHIDAVEQLAPHIDRAVTLALDPVAAPPSLATDADAVFDPATMGLFRELNILITAVGSGTRLTGTGVLPPTLAKSVAEEVGLAIGDLRSMRDCRPLLQLWECAVDTKLIAVRSMHAEPGAVAQEWLATGVLPVADALRFLIQFVVELTTDSEDLNRSGAFYQAIDDALVATLISGTTDNPQPVDAGSNDLFDGVLRQAIARIVNLGLLTIRGGAYVVPPVIAPIVAKAVEIGLTTELFVVRTELQEMEVPVWRTLELPSSLSLPLLHEVLQTAFGWNRSHLHEFDSGTTRYLPPYAEELLDDAGTAVDETAVLADLLPVAGPAAEYRYDFGDGWTVKLTLDSVGSAIRPLPCVTAGNGMGPLDDSGGPSGWGDMVAISNDPRHERSGEVRDWLSPYTEVPVDPTRFDLEEVNNAIAELFS